MHRRVYFTSDQHFGHSHSRMPGSKSTLDVGVDNIGFVPQTVQQLRQPMDTLPELDFRGIETDEPTQEFSL